MAAMRLKQSGRWRKWFGLKGHVWYFAPEPTEKSPVMTPATWSAVIATMGLITTAFFSYFNFQITRESFILQHPPVISVSQVEVRKRNGTFSVRMVLSNSGEGDANDVFVTLIFPLRPVDSEHVNVKRHDAAFATVALDTIPGWSDQQPIIGNVTVFAKNALGQAIAQASTCFVMRRTDVNRESAVLSTKDCKAIVDEVYSFTEPRTESLEPAPDEPRSSTHERRRRHPEPDPAPIVLDPSPQP